MKKRLLVPVIPAVACLAFAAPAMAADSEAVSQNWAGYEVTPNNGTHFSSVSGSWVQPSVKCTGGQAAYSAYWVGLGGGAQGSDALEQEGTQADCSASGKASYYAWYELVPSAPVQIDMKVSPGDRMWAKTAVSGNQVTVQVDNKTTGQNFSKTLTMTKATPDTSTAEWVAEAPSQCSDSSLSDCSVLSLANFGKVDFTRSYATTSDGHTGSINDSNWSATPIALESSSASSLGSGLGGYTGGYSTGYGDSGYGSGGYGSSSGDSGYGDSGYGDSGYGDSGYGDSGYGSDGYGSGYGDSGYGSDGGSYILVYQPYNAAVTSDGSGTASPSSLSSDGTSFSVSYGGSPSAGSTSGSGSTSASYGNSGYGNSGYGNSGYGDSGYSSLLNQLSNYLSGI